MGSAQTDQLASSVIRTNFFRARLVALALLIIHVVLLAVDIARLASGGLAGHPGYRWLFYAHITIVAGLALFAGVAALRPVPEDPAPGKLHDLAWKVLAFFMLYAAAWVSVIDQFIHEQITVYIIAALGIAAAVYMPLRFSVPLFATGHAGFIAALVTVQNNPAVLIADVINASIVVTLAVVISHVLYVQYRRNREHIKVIEEQRETLERLATEDSLTELPNRRSIGERVEQEFERGRRYGPIFAVAFADIDHFKEVNDRHSHAVGDEVLRRVAEVFRSALRAPDVVARYGGEEFLFLFPESNITGAASACEKIRTDLAAYDWEAVAPGLHLTASFGVASSLGHESTEDIIAAADEKLYEAKHAGRNCVCPREVA